MGSQIRRNAHEIMTQRTEDRRKDVGLNKRTDNRTAVNPKKQGLIEKDSDVLSAVNGGSVRIEEKIRRLPGDGWETKMKRKRSVAAVGNRVANVGRDIKRAMQPKLSSESKSRSCDTLGSRSKSSPGVSGINRSDGSFEATGSDANTVLRNELESTSIPRDRAAMLEQRVVKTNNKTSIQDGNQANGSTTMLKAKGSRAPRTGSIMVLDSSSKVHLSSGALQGWEQPNLNKIQALGVASNKKRPMSTGSSSHAISQWGGQRPHKISRTRRANLVSPVSNAEAPVSSQVIATPDFGVRASILTGGSLLGSSAENVTQKIKREPENASSPFGFSESEESGAGDSKSKVIWSKVFIIIDLISYEQFMQACHRSNSSKSAVRKVSKQVALAFAKRTLGRCRNFEQTGSSCFSNPPLQDAMFSVPPCSNETKSADCIGSGTASNTCNETSNHQAEAWGSGAVSSTFKRYDSSDSPLVIHSSEHAVSKYGSMLNKGRKREVLIDDVVGSASSKITSTLDGNVGVNGKRSDREQSRNTKDDRKTESKAKQKNNRLLDSGNGFNGRLTEPFLPTRPSSPGKINKNSTKETNESMDFELDTMEELGVPNELGGPQDLSSWFDWFRNTNG